MTKRTLAAIILAQMILAAPGLAQNYFYNPESAAYDPVGDRYFVANVGSGRIIQIQPGVDTLVYKTGYGRTMGMFVMDNRLWVCTNGPLAVFDLATGVLVDNFYVAGSVCLNDAAADSSGHVWITDSDASRVYRVTISDHSVATVIPYVYWPNGIMYDWTNDRVIFCAFGSNAPIRAIDPDDFTVQTLVTTPLTNLDGLTTDNDGNVYVSSWGSNRVYRYNPDFSGPPVQVSSGHSGPADIFFCHQTQHLVVPNFHRNTVDFLDFRDPDGDLLPSYQDNCPEISNPSQDNADGDAFGDVCDQCTDTDGDGYGNPGFEANTCPADNCPTRANPSQSDWGDGDGVGDDCDNCPLMANPDQIDSDFDGRGDVCDCCEGRVGDANGEGEYPDDVTLADIMLLVDVKFVSGDCSKLPCLHEADVNQDGGYAPKCDLNVTLGDIMMLVDFLFITGSENSTLADCL